MLQNAYLVAEIGADTAENERHFAENLPTTGNYPTGPLPYGSAAGGRGLSAADADADEGRVGREGALALVGGVRRVVDARRPRPHLERSKMSTSSD